jgi:hypothetical protein
MLADFNILPEEYQNIKPYPYYYQDNILDPKFALELQKEILEIPKDAFDTYDNPFETKLTFRDKNNFPELSERLFKYLESDYYINKVSKLCGYKLIKDPNRNFTQIHTYENNGKLDIHLDAEVHPITKDYKMITLGIYLSYDWKDTYGCDLEIWNGDSWKESNHKIYDCVTKVAPIFNRLIIFTNTNNSWHGNPNIMDGNNDSKRIFVTISYLSPNENKDNNQIFREKALFIQRPIDVYDEGKEKLIKIRADPVLYKTVYIYSK